jgi:uridine kinase
MSQSIPRIVLDAITRLLDEQGGPVLVAVDGPSGAGKSTVAAALAMASNAVVIPSDDFFAAEITAAKWDARDAAERARDCIDWRRLRRDALEPLRAGRAAEWRPFDFAAGERPDGTYAMARDLVRREPAPVVIVDGAYSARPELADLIDLSILIDVPAAVRHERLAAREAPAFLAAWHARWDSAESFYFDRNRPQATFDLIVDPSTCSHQGDSDHPCDYLIGR